MHVITSFPHTPLTLRFGSLPANIVGVHSTGRLAVKTVRFLCEYLRRVEASATGLSFRHLIPLVGIISMYSIQRQLNAVVLRYMCAS